MKSRHTITNFVTPLLSLAIAILASDMAVAQNGANAQEPQTRATQQQEQDDRQGTQRGANTQQSRETADDVQPDTDCIDLGPDATANANAQLSPEAIAQAERERDDCLDLIRNANGVNEDPQNEDSDNAPTSDDAADSPAPGNAD
jgi:hypothetical protein